MFIFFGMEGGGGGGGGGSLNYIISLLLHVLGLTSMF